MISAPEGGGTGAEAGVCVEAKRIEEVSRIADRVAVAVIGTPSPVTARREVRRAEAWPRCAVPNCLVAAPGRAIAFELRKPCE